MRRRAFFAAVSLIALMGGGYLAGWRSDAAMCVALVALAWVNGYRCGEDVEQAARRRYVNSSNHTEKKP